MSKIENKSGSNGGFKSRSDYDSIGQAFAESEGSSEIRKANSINLRSVLAKYRIVVNSYTTKMICPFKDHKNGKEKTPSFMIYDETNSFHCFGCHCSGKPVDFIRYYENISKQEAAKKILSIINNENVELNSEYSSDDFNSKNKLLIAFAEFILTFKKTYTDDVSARYIENICKVYDNLSDNLSSEALNELNTLIFKKVNSYTNKINNITYDC